APPAPTFAFNSSGLYWGVAPDAMTLNLPTVALAVSTTDCDIAQVATLTHNSTTYVWSSSGISACAGLMVSETLQVYATNTSNGFVKEVYLRGSYTKAGTGSVSTLLNFPLSFSGPATVNSTGAFLPGGAFEWAKIAQFSPVWNSSSDSLTVASPSSNATAVTFSYDPTLVQTGNCAAASCAYGSSITSGNLLVVASTYGTLETDPFAPTISDSRSNTWSEAVQQEVICGVAYCYSTLWYSTASSSGADTVTIGPSGQDYTTYVFEVSGALGTVSGTAVGTGTYCSGTCGAPLLLETGSSVSFSSYGFAVGDLYPGCSGSTANEAGYSIGTITSFPASVVYSVSGVSSPTSFGIDLQSAGGCIANYVDAPYVITGAVFARATVTQPVTATASGVSTGTISDSGCSVSPASFSGDGSSHNLSAFSGCAITLTAPTGDMWTTSGTSTATLSTCSSGTCTGADYTYTNQTSIEPVQCTMANGASPVTLTLSGGYPSPSTVTCDGSVHDVTVDSSVTLTATEPSHGSTERQRFSGGNTTSVTVCSSETCSPTWSFTNYNQYKETVAYSVTCVSGTCNPPTLTYYQHGSSTYSTLSTSATSYWMDQGTIASASLTMTDSANNEYTPYFSSWLISGANVIDTPIVYWEGL
ncbi:MAG: hypothetical protein OK456_10845, partial [Thaumarchaeota archaeon]|nr:hypothetical protein [Nitrososphaerota archaeon]